MEQQASGQIPTPSSSPNTNRTVRAPATIIKPPSRLNQYSNLYLTHNRFRILNPAGSSTIVKASQNQPYQSSQQAITTATAVTSTTSNNPPTSPRINLTKPSGLVRPTPIKQIQTQTAPPASTTKDAATLLKQPQTRLPTCNSRLGIPKPAFRSDTVVRTVDRSKALANAKLSPSQSQAQNLITSTSKKPLPSHLLSSALPQKLDVEQHQAGQAGQPAAGIDISSIENDVGQIRQLLEQLLMLLSISHKDQESLVQENERLKKEVAELKSTIRAIKSTVTADRDSEVQLAINQNEVQQNCANSERVQFFSPPPNDEKHNNHNDNNNDRPRSSIYMSPYL